MLHPNELKKEQEKLRISGKNDKNYSRNQCHWHENTLQKKEWNLECFKRIIRFKYFVLDSKNLKKNLKNLINFIRHKKEEIMIIPQKYKGSSESMNNLYH